MEKRCNEEGKTGRNATQNQISWRADENRGWRGQGRRICSDFGQINPKGQRAGEKFAGGGKL